MYAGIHNMRRPSQVNFPLASRSLPGSQDVQRVGFAGEASAAGAEVVNTAAVSAAAAMALIREWPVIA